MTAPNTIRRTTGDVIVEVTWPGSGPTWDDLPKSTRNALLSHLDAVAEIILVHLPETYESGLPG